MMLGTQVPLVLMLIITDTIISLSCPSQEGEDQGHVVPPCPPGHDVGRCLYFCSLCNERCLVTCPQLAARETWKCCPSSVAFPLTKLFTNVRDGISEDNLAIFSRPHAMHKIK